MYLDVRLQINNEELRTTLCHKVENSKFPVVLLTFPDSAIPNNMGINVFASQVLRYCRICSHINDVIFRKNKTLLLQSSRGYSKVKMKKCTEKMLTNHDDVGLLVKFGFFSSRQLTSLCSFQINEFIVFLIFLVCFRSLYILNVKQRVSFQFAYQ